jgi:hypothetical protein
MRSRARNSERSVIVITKEGDYCHGVPSSIPATLTSAGGEMKSMDKKLVQINPAKRLAYTFVGLLAGNVMLLFLLLKHALHATLLAGEPARMIGDTLQLFVLYAVFSILGWLLIGLPTALIFPAGFITRLSWPFALIVGAGLGPPALLVIFVLLGRGHVYFRNFTETGTLFGYSILVSTMAFMVYLALLRKEMKDKSTPSNISQF